MSNGVQYNPRDGPREPYQVRDGGGRGERPRVPSGSDQGEGPRRGVGEPRDAALARELNKRENVPGAGATRMFTGNRMLTGFAGLLILVGIGTPLLAYFLKGDDDDARACRPLTASQAKLVGANPLITDDCVFAQNASTPAAYRLRVSGILSESDSMSKATRLMVLHIVDAALGSASDHFTVGPATDVVDALHYYTSLGEAESARRRVQNYAHTVVDGRAVVTGSALNATIQLLFASDFVDLLERLTLTFHFRRVPKRESDAASLYPPAAPAPPHPPSSVVAAPPVPPACAGRYEVESCPYRDDGEALRAAHHVDESICEAAYDAHGRACEWKPNRRCLPSVSSTRCTTRRRRALYVSDFYRTATHYNRPRSALWAQPPVAYWFKRTMPVGANTLPITELDGAYKDCVHGRRVASCPLYYEMASNDALAETGDTVVSISNVSGASVEQAIKTRIYGDSSTLWEDPQTSGNPVDCTTSLRRVYGSEFARYDSTNVTQRAQCNVLNFDDGARSINVFALRTGVLLDDDRRNAGEGERRVYGLAMCESPTRLRPLSKESYNTLYLLMLVHMHNQLFFDITSSDDVRVPTIALDYEALPLTSLLDVSAIECVEMRDIRGGADIEHVVIRDV